MSKVVPPEWTPTNTTNVQVLSAIEALLFVLVGVFAVRLPLLIGVPVGLAIVFALALIRWMNAAPARKRDAMVYLWERYGQRSLLLNDLQDIVGHDPKNRWGYWDLTRSVQWWFDEELLPEYWNLEAHEREGKRRQKQVQIRYRRSVRTRLAGLHFRVRRWLEQTMTREPGLIDAVYRVGNAEVARIILTRAIDEEFIIEHLETGPHRMRITYALNADMLRPAS